MLAAMAVSAYSRYGYRARRVDGQQILLTIAHAQERFYATNNKYTDDPAQFGFAHPVSSEHGYYAVTLETSGKSAQGYIARAQPTGNQQNDACGDLTIDNIGNKTPDASDASANANGSCW
jgi:type IV pilus assembly protein PilE